MKYHLQKRASSKEEWQLCETLNSKQECKAKFALLATQPNDRLDWQVGFLLRLRSGLEYQVIVAKTGKVLTY